MVIESSETGFSTAAHKEAVADLPAAHETRKTEDFGSAT
jgi:hypothetical protein